MTVCVRPLLFCHIPKTAGTAFRVALERVLPAERVLRDYGSNRNFTTADLPVRLQESPCQWDLLCGHFPLGKYGGQFSPYQAVTFLRRPLQQLVSHYEHYCRQNNYTGDLQQFADESHGAGMQSRMLGGVPPQLLGAVGITEEIEHSTRALKLNLGLEVEIPRWNENPDKSGDSYAVKIEDFSPAARARLQKDFWVYVQARRTLAERMRFGGTVWTHGAVTRMTTQQLCGVAFRPRDSQVHIPLRIHLNGSEHAFGCTGHSARDLSMFDTREISASAFELNLEKPLQAGDILDIHCADTSQWLDSVIWHGAEAVSAWMPAPLKHRPV